MKDKTGIYKQLRIAAIREEAPGFKSFVFEEGHDIQYKAGQYLTLVKWQGNTEIRRSYSITSSPALNEPLAIGVKRIPNGIFSRMLVDDAKTGDVLTTIGSGGFFVFPNEIAAYKQVFFFAAGSGITPVYSLLKTVLHSHPHLQVVLIYSNHTESSAVFLEELKQLQQDFPERFHLRLLFSNNPQLREARLHREMIQQLVDDVSIAAYDKTLCYLCGPVNYMRLCLYTLTEKGIPADNIKQEDFIIPPRPKVVIEPPDKLSHKVTLHMGGKNFKLTVGYPDTILKAAKKEGIALPYSCEAGRCGSCVARCTSGEIWHSYNEVLTEHELQKGLVLTCVGYPVFGDAVLEI